MAIKSEDVKRLAKLARLKLTEAEVNRLGRDLEQISEYVTKLAEISPEGDAPLEPVLPLVKTTDPLRDDRSRAWFTAHEATAGSADARDGFFRVPTVIDRQSDSDDS